MSCSLGAQTWSQLTSSSLELPNSELIIKHGSDWYIGYSGGLYRTSDNGLHWQNVNGNLYSALNRLRVEAMVSVQGKLLVLNRWEGLVSTTNGNTWVSAETNLPSPYVAMIDPVVLNTRVLLPVYDVNDDSYAIYYSDNAGDSWTKGATFAAEFSLYCDGSKVHIFQGSDFVSETTNGVNIVASSISGFPGTEVGFLQKSGDYIMAANSGSLYRYKTTDPTGWEDVSSNLGTIGYLKVGGNGAGTIYASVLNGDMTIHFKRSADAGSTWADISPTVAMGMPFANTFCASGNELMCLFVDDGTYYSANSGDSFVLRATGALATDFEELVSSGSNLVTSLMLSGAYVSDDEGATWSAHTTGLPNDAIRRIGGFVKSGNTLYCNYANTPDDKAEPIGIYASTDDGLSWSAIPLPASATNARILGRNGSTIFAYCANLTSKYWRSSDNGQNWTDISAAMPASISKILQLAGDGTNTYFVGLTAFYQEQIYRTTNNGDSWSLAMDGIESGSLTSFTENYYKGLLVTLSGKAFVQLHFANWVKRFYRWNGAGWTELVSPGNGMPYVDVSTMAYSAGRLYVGTFSQGVYYSDDDGNQFFKINGLPDGAEVRAITILNGRVYLSANCGVWVVDVPTNVAHPIAQETIIWPNPADQQLNIPENVELVEIFNLSGELVLTAKPIGNSLNISSLQKGSYLIHLKGNSLDKVEKLIVK